MPSLPSKLTFGRIAAVVAIGVYCSSCARLFGVPDVSDVALVRVEVVRYEAPLDPQVRKLVDLYSYRKTLLSVTLLSTSDLASIESRIGASIGVRGSICPLGAGTNLDVWYAVYETYHDVPTEVEILSHSQVWREAQLNHPQEERQTHIYTVYFFDRRRATKPDAQQDPPYDLSQNPQDVCLKIYGSRELLPPLETNVVVVPAQAIHDALEFR